MKSTKEITEVELIKVSVQGLDGLTFDVLVDTEQRQVRFLKDAIQQEQGITSFSQQLFLLAKSGKVEEAGEQRPLDNGDDVAGDCSMLLCIQTQQGLLSLLFISSVALISFLFLEFKWDVSSPLFAASTAAGGRKGQLKLSGPDNCIATKIGMER